MQEVDDVFVGAGHNGLAAAALRAKRGLRVVCLEKNHCVDGMAGTREILTGCRNDVGASILFPLAPGLMEELELLRYGVELIDLPIMSCTLSGVDDPSVLFYANPLRLALGIGRRFGTRALLGFARLVAFTRAPAKAMARYAKGSEPRDLDAILAEAPSPRGREQLELAFRGSAMDIVDRFFPDAARHRVRGGMGALSEALARSLEAKGGELPRNPPATLQIPSVLDPTLAPEGFHIGTSYGFYFPCEAPKQAEGKLRDEMAERIIDRLGEVYPGFRELIVESAVFSSDHFATMQGATGGDFTHGLIHPDQMLGARTLVPGSAHRTPVPGFWMCGSSCHPGPGVTFLPGYGAATEVARALQGADR